MKRLLLIAGLVLASGTAEARTISLYGPHATCSRVEVVAPLADTSDGQASWEHRLMREVDAGRCVVLPKGTQVTVEGSQGIFSCIRPQGLRVCGWTVLHPSQR